MKLMEMMTAGQVARRLNVSTARISQLRQEGKLRGVRTQLGYLYSEQELLRLLRERGMAALKAMRKGKTTR